MVFSSILFLFYFFPIVLVLYFASPKKFRNVILFVASLIFYAWGEPVYIILMLITITIGFFSGKVLDRFLKSGQQKQAKLVVIITIIVDLGILGFFKYGDFLLNNLNAWFNLGIPALDLPLPIGISFYTFQTMSYTIDLYRGDAKVQNNYIAFGTYVALFPQLIAGPIVRFKTVAEELDHRQENVDDFASGIQRFVLGLGKKVLLANNIGMLWDSISAMDVGNLPVLTAWIGILAYTFQIYFDFSGYSDMAIGLGRMFGFHFLENFNYPYLSKSITEFWRRWHISLSTWFRDYVYIPLGGSRRGPARNVLNLLVVWALTGLWHGASWNFVLWGLYYFVLLMIERMGLRVFLDRHPLISHAYSLLAVMLGWGLFAIEGSFGALGVFFGKLFSLTGGNEWMFYLRNYAVVLALGILFSMPVLNRIRDRHPKVCRALALPFLGLILVLSVAYLVDSTYNPFLYWNF